MNSTEPSLPMPRRGLEPGTFSRVASLRAALPTTDQQSVPASGAIRT